MKQQKRYFMAWQNQAVSGIDDNDIVLTDFILAFCSVNMKELTEWMEEPQIARA